jgi:ribosome-binding factor A
MKRGYDRTARVADLIQKALAPILQQEVSAPIGLVTITGVAVSRDLSYATIYVSVLTDEQTKVKETIKLLNREAKNIRFSLAKAVKLRIVPEIKFVFDESTAHGFHISQLIDKATKK